MDVIAIFIQYGSEEVQQICLLRLHRAGRKSIPFHHLSKSAVKAQSFGRRVLLVGSCALGVVRWVLGSRCVLGLDTMGMGIGIGDTWCV